MSSNKQTLMMYQQALEQLNKYFRKYNNYNTEQANGKVLHFTSRQMRNFPNLIKLYQRGPDFTFNSRHTAPDQFEEMYHNVQLLKDLKVTCIDDFIVELQHFQSLENILLVGPCLHAVKGLRSTSSNLKSLIVESGNITLHELLSLCCMDESRPMSWPCLLSLKVSNCCISSLDTSLKLLPNLQELDLSLNRISLIHNELSCLDHLTHLNLGFNHLVRFPQFNGEIQQRLQYLYLPYNELSTLDGVQALETLLELDISHNFILNHDDLQPLRYLSRLQKLDLYGNPIGFHRRHRDTCLLYISPQAVGPEFVLDGVNLTKHDLKVAMYTPTAVSYHRVNSGVGAYASINSIEPEAYDVSMSSAADTSNRRFEGDSYFKLCSHQIKKKKNGSSLNKKSGKEGASAKIQYDVMLSGAHDLLSSSVTTEPKQESIDDSSIVSGITEHDTSAYPDLAADDDADADDKTSYFELVQSIFNTHVTGLNGTAGEYLTLERGKDQKVVVKDEDVDFEKSDSLSISDGANESFTTSDDSSTTYNTVMLSLLVKRNIDSSAEYVLDGPKEALLNMTGHDILEIDIETGNVWEKLELSIVVDVHAHITQQVQVLDIKFSYMRRDRRSRHYIFASDTSLEDIKTLIRKLDSTATLNQGTNRQTLVCLKCGSLMQATLHAATLGKAVCVCGSDMVVKNEEKIHEKGDDRRLTINDDCEEAVETVTMDDVPNVYDDVRTSAIRTAGSRSAVTDVSLSWMHTVNSVHDVTALFEDNEGIHPSDSHLSGSLPNDLSKVLSQPHSSSNLRSTISSSVVNSSQPQNSPFKSFRNLLPPQELYKLVNVTPSISTLRNKNSAASVGKDVLDKEMSHTEVITPHTSMQGRDDQAGDDYMGQKQTEMIVTSTPRRRPSDIAGRVASHTDSCPRLGSSQTLDVPRHRRALHFGDNDDTSCTNKEMETPHVDEKSNFNVIEYCNFSANEMLKHFIEEELLEVQEEMTEFMQVGLITETGNSVVTFISSIGSGGKRGLFGSAKKQKESSFSPLFHQIDAIIVLTTANIHILKLANSRKEICPENLSCFASHPLQEVIGVEVGLSNCTLYMAISAMKERKKKYSIENFNCIYAIYFRDQDKCQHFYQSWLGVISSSERESSNASSTSDAEVQSSVKHGIEKCHTNDPITCSLQESSPFSDFLEKSLSEDVLLHMNLNMPDGKPSQGSSKLLATVLFSYNPCWILDDASSSDISVSLVVSCGGDMCIVMENTRIIISEFAFALVRAIEEKRKSSGAATPNSSAHSSAGTSPCRRLPQSSIKTRLGSVYTIKESGKCSTLKSVVRYVDQTDCLQLNFIDEEISVSSHNCWRLRFMDSSTAIAALSIIGAYWSTEHNSNLPTIWN